MAHCESLAVVHVRPAVQLATAVHAVQVRFEVPPQAVLSNSPATHAPVQGEHARSAVLLQAVVSYSPFGHAPEHGVQVVSLVAVQAAVVNFPSAHVVHGAHVLPSP